MDDDLMGDEFVIEVVDSSEIPPSELSQFEETLPLEYIDTVPDSPGENKPTDDTEETLIQKFVSGEVEFPDVYTRLDADDEDDDLPAETSTSNRSEERHFQEFAREGTTNTSLDEDDLAPGFSGRKSSRTTFRKRPVLNATLLGLMGEANLCFARGQVDMAEKICLEIIRQNPLAPDPFFTLAEIYENRDKEKYLNFLTIAAHLDPHDRDQWIRIAEMYIEQKNYARARVYYSKAIKCLHKDYDLRLRKAKLLEMMNEHHNAMFTYLKMIPLVPVERGELCIVTAKNVARHFYTNKKMTYALEAMEGAYGVVRHLFSAEDINLFLELLMINKNYQRVLYVLKEQTKLELITETQENDEELIMFCVIPDDMVSDLRAKLCVSLIHLKTFHLLDYLITNIHKFIPFSSRVDLYIDIAEAIMQESKFEEALRLLEPIISANEIEPPAFLWLRHAECLRELKRNEQAIDSYFRVVELAPYCYDAKFTLSALLKQEGRHREAIKALEQDLEGEKMNPRLLYERCLMLKTVEEIDQYIDVGYVLLARNSIKLKSREEMMAASNGSSFINEDGVKTIIETRLLKQEDKNELLEYKKSADNNSDLTIDDEYHLFLDLVKTCYDRNKYGAMEKLCFAMVTTKRFMPYTSELERIIILACYFNNDTGFSFAYFRDVFTKNIDKTYVWNFYTLLIQKGEDLRYHRFLRRALARSRSPQFMRIFLAHYHLYCCSYKYALNIYVPLLKEYPEPIVYMCISVVFSQIALQKKVLRKPAAIGQAVAFMKKYADTRMCPETAHEVYYNMGRMYHQACMNHLAMHYYEKALALSNELVSKHKSILGLQQQIAFNMHLIYRASGNRDMARDCLYKYIVI